MIYHHYRGKEWAYAVVDPGASLSERARIQLLEQMLDLYSDKKQKANVKGEGYEGVIRKSGKNYSIGTVFGAFFKGDLETEQGKSSWDLIVREVIDPSLN